MTGASGFIGSRVINQLLDLGFRNIRCFVRPFSSAKLQSLASRMSGVQDIQVFEGNLLSREDCASATKNAAVILHLAAGRGEKSYPDALLNSVVTTRNLIEASMSHGRLRRFVSISSFAVYSNTNKSRRRLLDESCPVEARPELAGRRLHFRENQAGCNRDGVWQ